MAEIHTGIDESVTRAVSYGSVTRAANDRIYDVVWGFEVETGLFLCECGRPFCTEEVVLTAAEYVRLRDRDEFVYAAASLISSRTPVGRRIGLLPNAPFSRRRLGWCADALRP